MYRSFAMSVILLMPVGVFAQSATAGRPTITGISHLTLFADNIPKSEEFYRALLGWQQVPSAGAASGVRFYANHLQYVELLTPPRPGLPDRLESVSFSVGDAEALRRYLSARGVSVPSAVTREQNGDRSFAVHDPEGNKVGFTQAGPHPPAAPESLSSELSSHIMHAGYVVRNREALDHFYKDLLGFHLYWQGGNPDTQTNWVMMQVPDGTDWIEYMLLLPASPSLAQLSSANHLAPGVGSVADLQAALQARGWKPAGGKDPKVLGVDGKLQLDLHDPDGTRIEFMEFAPVKQPCCSPYTGAQPTAATSW